MNKAKNKQINKGRKQIYNKLLDNIDKSVTKAEKELDKLMKI